MDVWKVPLLVTACINYGHLGYLNLQDQELISLYEECLIMSEYFGDIFSVIQLYMLLGELKAKMHCLEESSEDFNKMLKVSERNGQEINAIFAFLNIAMRYEVLYRFHKAIEFYKRVLIFLKKIGIIDKGVEGTVCSKLAYLYATIGELHKMKECSEKCIKIGKKIRDKNLEVKGYLNLGCFYNFLGKWNEGIAYNEESIKFALQLDDKNEANLILGRAYVNIGIAYRNLGNFGQAQSYLERGLKINKEIGYRRGEVGCYTDLGNLFLEQGKFQEAINYYQKGISISIRTKLKSSLGALYENLGTLYYVQGKYHKAIQCYERALEVQKDIGNRLAEGEIYRQFSKVYSEVGKFQECIEYLEKSLAITIEKGYIWGQMKCYAEFGSIYTRQSEYEKGKEYYLKCLNCALEYGDKREEGLAYSNIGNLLILRVPSSSSEEAVEYLEKALNIAKSINDKFGEGRAYCRLGKVYVLKRETYDKGIKCLENSIDISMNIGYKSIASYALTILGYTYFDLSVVYAAEGDEENCQDAKDKSEKKLKEALQYFEWSFSHLEDLYDFKISIFDTSTIRTYKLLMKLLIERQKIEEALLIGDRWRARSLGDSLVSKYGEDRPPSQTPLDSTDLERVLSSNRFCVLLFATGFEAHLHTWVLTHGKPIVFANNDSQALNVCTLLDEFYNKIEEMQTIRCEDRSLESTENLRLPANVRGKNQTKVSLSERTVVPEEPPLNVTEQTADQLEALFSLLVTPVLQSLQHEEIVIIPEGPLFMVPFAALRDPTTGKHLSETKSIRISPSLATLKTLQECAVDYHSKTGALIVGDPDVGDVVLRGEKTFLTRLPSAKREADAIAAILNATSLTGSQATKEMVMKKLREGVAVIHIAAHGDSENGHIALAPPPRTDTSSIPEEQDYMLTMQEVQEIGVKAQLVVLSCCHSGRGDIKAEGVVGMSRAFLAAGARAVVASLWAINDRATMKFMSSFYASLKMGESAGKSLQIAMDDIREEQGYEDPKYWAPFFLIGDDVTINV